MADAYNTPLEEHRGNAPSERNATYDPSDEEKRAIKLVNKCLDRARAFRKQYDDKWLDNYKMFRGKQWLTARPSYLHSEVINFIFQTIQSIIPKLTDARPRIEYLPTEPSDIEFANILSDVAQSDWDKGNWLYRIGENLLDSHLYGCGLGEVCYDHDKEYGMGGVEFKSIDPFYFFPDPAAKDINVEARYHVYAEPIDVEIVRRRYPDKKDFIKPDLIDLINGDKSNIDQVKFKSPVDNKTISEGYSSGSLSHKDECLLITLYIKDDEYLEEEVDKLGSDGMPIMNDFGVKQTEFIQTKKYPNGRKIVMSNNVILEDGPNPYEDGEFPYARLVNYILSREFWGMSEVEQLRSPQMIFNKLLSFTLDVLTIMGNPIWVVDDDANIDIDNLINRPGLVVQKAKGSEARRESGVQLQPYVLQIIDRMEKWFEGVSGDSDVSRGINPTGVTAASAITALQESAQTRIRQKSRNLDAYLQRVGQLYKNRVLQFYSAPRVFRLTNNQGANNYFKMYVENVPNEYGGQSKKVTIRGFNEAGQEDINAREYMLKGDFDVRVTTGSSLPFAKKEKADTAFRLMQLGIIDGPELLDAIDYPNAEAVWNRVQQRMQEKAAAEAAAQVPSGGGQGSPPPGGP